MQTLQSHRSKIRSLSFSPDGGLLASCGGHGTVVSLWRLAKGKRSYLKGHNNPVHRVRFAARGGFLLSCEQFANSGIWVPDATGAWTARPLTAPHVDFVGGGEALAYFDERFGGTAQVEYVEPNAIETVRRALPVPALRGLTLFAGSPIGFDVAMARYDYRAGTGHIALARPEQPEPVVERPLAAIPYAVCFSPDGATVAAGTTKSLQRFDVGTGDELLALKGHTRMVTGLAYLPDGRLLSCSTDGTARTWDHASAKCLTSHDWQMGELTAVAVAADGMRAAAGSDDGEILIWDLD